MLCSLDIRDILIIDHLEIDFKAGLNVLTGETGAGKSILLDSLGFVLGWRGRADLVRQGADQGEVIADFQISATHPVIPVLQEAGLPFEGELILRRVNTKDGRKTAWVNDRRVSGEVLRAISLHLVELHGQHDDRGLLDPKGHMALLDQFGGYGAEIDEVKSAWTELRRAERALAAEEEKLVALKDEEEFLRHAVQELTSLDPQVGEDEALDKQRRLMQGAERILQDVGRAGQALGRDGAEGAMSDALSWLEGAAIKAEGTLDAAINALSRAMVELQDASAEIDGAMDGLAFNPHELETVEERLFTLRGVARKHQVSVDELPALMERLSNQLSALDAGAGNVIELQRAVKDAKATYDTVVATLSEHRTEAAQRLDTAMAQELAPLKMERAVFSTIIERAPVSSLGQDAVSFQVATNPGAPSGPLAKIASGGELSRFLLALKVCLSGDGAQTTMIFDEIDRGVGGATADAVGRRLASLAQDGQVLVVTHSPQVAALGVHHLQVSKTQTESETLSRVIALTSDQRVDEIARMISGDVVTDPAKLAAQSLLAH